MPSSRCHTLRNTVIWEYQRESEKVEGGESGNVYYEKTLEWLPSIWFGTTKNMATVFEYLKAAMLGKEAFFLFGIITIRNGG